MKADQNVYLLQYKVTGAIPKVFCREEPSTSLVSFQNWQMLWNISRMVQ